MYLMVPNCRITPYNKGAFVPANLPRIFKSMCSSKSQPDQSDFLFLTPVTPNSKHDQPN